MFPTVLKVSFRQAFYEEWSQDNDCDENIFVLYVSPPCRLQCEIHVYRKVVQFCTENGQNFLAILPTTKKTSISNQHLLTDSYFTGQGTYKWQIIPSETL